LGIAMITLPTPKCSSPIPWLDSVLRELQQGVPWFALDRLFSVLHDLRAEMAPNDWLAWTDTEFVEHPLFAVLMEDPMLRRSQEKPRGYPGDAVLLDYIYRIRGPVDGSPIGREVWDHCTSTRPAALAVQARRRIIACALDDLRRRPAGARRALAVACGHFREGHLSEAVRERALDEVVALDSDAESLAVVSRLFGAAKVRIEPRSAARLLGDRHLGTFDLVYSAGLYDYLEEPFARRLTEALFEKLTPGGRLLVCNFVPQIYDAGFMESAMGWRLIYRTESQLRALADALPPAELQGATTWTDPFEAVAYLLLERRA